MPFLDYVDAAAPGVAVAQALGRWGNWFNNELYGRATDLPWGLTIHEWDQAAGHAVRDASGKAVVLGHLPADVPLRVAVVPARWPSSSCWPTVAAPCARASSSAST